MSTDATPNPPEQSPLHSELTESLRRHRERMAEIHARSLESVAELARINSQGILEHGIYTTQRTQQAIDAAVDAVRKASSSGQGNSGPPQGTG